ncbi:hypothetical protein LINPERHAP2_LOCUS13366 [Linum perenne]
MDLRKWTIRPEGAQSPDYDSEKEFRFTVEMHYDGLLTSDDYEFGTVAFFDRVDPDYFSLTELMAMAERVGVQDEYYQFLWAKPGQEIKDRLQTIEGEADILTCIGEDGLNGKHHLLKVFVKKMTRFQAWKRMVDIQKQLCDLVPDIGDGFRLEELGDDGTPIREAVGGSGLSVIPNPLLLGCSATAEGVVDQSAPDKPDQNTYHESSTNEPAKVGEAAIEDMNPPVLTDQGTHGVDEIEGDHAIHPATEVTEADQFAEGSTRWLDIDEILAEMHNEMQAEAEADQIQVNDDNYSFSSPSIYSSPSQHDFWDGRYNAYSSEDSDRPFNSRRFSREPTPISSDESDETYTPEGFENANLSTDSSDCDPLPGIERHDSNDDSGNGEQSDSRSVHPEWVQGDATDGQADAGRMDSMCNEEELLEERGWGSEEDDEDFREKGDKYKTEEGLTPLEWMQRRQTTTWCKYYFDTKTSCENSLNNHCESFNRWILEARDMPILSCLETIRFKMMRRVHGNYQRLARLDPEALCPNAWVRLRERKQPVTYCYPTFSGDGQYEVREGLRSWVVDLRLFRCACGLWQLSGLPCQHALACIAHNKEAVEPYCDPCYKVASYRAAYRHPIKPLNDFSQWEVSFGPNLRPPTIQRPTSGPKQRKRRPEAGELISRKDKRGTPYSTVGKSGQPQKCTICKKTGHNRRAHGNDQVQMDGGSSSTRPPEQPSQEATPAVRNVRSKQRVRRGGRVG